MVLLDLQLISLIVISISAGILILLEMKFPYNKNQSFFRNGFWSDFAYYNVLQSFLLGVLISYFIEYIDSSTSVSRLRLFFNFPIWMQVMFFLITHDLYIYWFHQLQHKNKYLWRLHEAHHSSKEVDWLSGIRSHGLEIFINQTVEFLPIVLLGAAPEVAVIKGMISAIWGMYIHSNIDVRTGFMQYFFNGPEMHRWHHSAGKGRNRNFATKLALWDWIFGTAYFPRNQKANEYGLKTFFPENYFIQFIFAFRKFKR